MAKKDLTCIFIIVSLILVSSIVYAEESIKISLNSTKIIEPSAEPQISKIGIQSTRTEINLDKEKFQNKANEELINNLGENYFKEHIEYKETKILKDFICIKYKYNYKFYDVDMLVCYDSKEKLKPQMSTILDFPQEINFDEEDALSKADKLNLSLKRNLKLIYDASHKTLAWKIILVHEPTQEEKIQEIIKGYSFSVKDGKILRTYKFGFEPIGEPNLYSGDEVKINKETPIFQKIKNFFNNFLRWFNV